MKAFLHNASFKCFMLFLALIVTGRSFAQVQTGKSYINVSKNISGGTFEPGDTLEIRAAIAVGNFAAFSITQARYNDTIGSSFTYIPNSIKILTNEGFAFRSWTDAASDDAAIHSSINGTVRINMGKTAGNAANTGNGTTGGGTISYNDKPSFYNGVCIMVASFRIKINSVAAYNTTVTLPGGAFRYTEAGVSKVVALSSFTIMLFQNIGVCPNYVGTNAVIENNGTFGSGTTQNRSASAIVPGYTFANFASGQPSDGSYGISNNSSATGATNNGVAYPNSTRVFTVWDILGDHTNASNNLTGNNPVSPGINGGYMVVVNASYATSAAIEQTITNLCPATYYDFSAWFRNICPKCSCDSNGKGATDIAFNGPNPAGVKPNLTFQLNGIDYYTTGDIAYTGNWAKKGFTYLTGALQTSFTFSIRNNSPGGGGNDWAIDDISLATCEPDIALKYSPVFISCGTTSVDLSAKIRCYFSNYAYYKWQKSTDGGTTWLDTGITGIGLPTIVSGQWEYTAVYPIFLATLLDSGQRYRVVVATTAGNLASTSCKYNNGSSTMLDIRNCGAILAVKLKDFAGQVIDAMAQLQWTTASEKKLSRFEIEKSDNGINFNRIGVVQAVNNSSGNHYTFNDPVKLAGTTLYRLKMIAEDSSFAYSPVVSLSNKETEFEIRNVTNPFADHITVDYITPKDGLVKIHIFDIFGRLIKKQLYTASRGFNSARLEFLNATSQGVYMLTVTYDNKVLSKKIMHLR